MAVGLHRFVRFIGFTGTGSVLAADLRVMFPIVGINRLDVGMESVEVVWFADSCNVVLDEARKSVVELVAEGSITPLDFGGELLKADDAFSNFLVITHFEPFKLIFSISFNVKHVGLGPIVLATFQES